LQEVSLAEKMQVSRTPVREALRVLAKDGLLSYAPNKGYMVKGFSLKNVLEAFQVRAVLEGLAARLTAESGLTETSRQELVKCIKEGDETALEKLVNSHRIKKRIREEKTHHIRSQMQAGTDDFVSLDVSLANLYKKNAIQLEDGALYAEDEPFFRELTSGKR